MTIVEELRQNRESGAKRLIAEYKAGLMTLARRFCVDPGDAEELVNRTFAAVVEGIDDYLEQSAFFAWMCQILTNIHNKDCRNKSNGIVIHPGEVPDIADEGAEDRVYRELDASLLRDAVERLPEEQREAVVLHYFADMPVAKIARYLKVPTGTVLSRLHYARKALAVKLGAKAEEAKATAKKPGVKATLAIIALCALTALGAAGIARWGELSERAATVASGGATSTLPAIGETSGTGGYSPVASTPSPVPPDSPVPPVSDVPFVPDVPSTTLSSKDPTMNTTTRTAALGAATALALAAAPPAASADGYQYIVSGNPEYDPPASFLASGGTSLAGGPLSNRSAADALDARYRTAKASAGTGFRSDKYSGFSIILR